MNKEALLIVETDPTVAQTAGENLVQWGYTVTDVVNSSEKAIDSIKRHKPDIVLFDLHLAGEGNGTDAAEGIRSRYEIPVILTANLRDEEVMEGLKPSKPFSYVLKPFQRHELKAALEMASYYAKIDSKRKLAESALRRSERRLSTHIRSTPMGVIEFDNDFKITSWNPGAKKIFGYSAEEALGQNTFDILVPEYEKAGVEKVHLIENPVVSENINDNKRKDGSIITCQWFNTPLFDEQGKVEGMTAVCRDITDQLKTEQALKDSEAQKKAILDGISAEITYVNTDLEILWVNKAGAKSAAKAPEEMLGSKCYSFFGNAIAPCDNCPAMRVLETKKPERSIVITKDGRICDERSEPIFDSKGALVGIVEIVLDITQYKKAEADLQKAHHELENKVRERTVDLERAIKEAEKANRAKSDFLANVSHELRTPMHHILNYSKNGIKKINQVSQEKLLHYFTQIRKSGDRLLSLLNDLLDLSKLESGQSDYEFEETDLKPLIEAIIAEFSTTADEKLLHVELREPEISTLSFCDPLRIGQVVRNLIANALKFSATGQSVEISFKADTLHTRKKQAHQKEIPALRISVKDRGIGIPESELDSVFNKFIQSSRTKTSAGGTGLGLAICREIVEHHQGRIWAENNPEGGAIISFVLPLKREAT